MKKQRTYGKNNTKPDNKEISQAIYTINKLLHFDNHINITEKVSNAISILEELKNNMNIGEHQLSPQQQINRDRLFQAGILHKEAHPETFGAIVKINPDQLLKTIISGLKEIVK